MTTFRRGSIRGPSSTELRHSHRRSTLTSCCCIGTRPTGRKLPKRQDGILEAQQKIIRTHGASVHGLPALRQMPVQTGSTLVDPHQPQRGAWTATYEDSNHPDNVSEVVNHIQLKRRGWA